MCLHITPPHLTHPYIITYPALLPNTQGTAAPSPCNPVLSDAHVTRFQCSNDQVPDVLPSCICLSPPCARWDDTRGENEPTHPPVQCRETFKYHWRQYMLCTVDIVWTFLHLIRMQERDNLHLLIAQNIPAWWLLCLRRDLVFWLMCIF